MAEATLAERADYLRRLVVELGERREQVLNLQTEEMGATRRFVEENFNLIGPSLERMIADADKIPFHEMRDGTVGKVLVMREPVGVTAAVTPWNSPVMVVLSNLFPSLQMGCPIVIKPAPESPLSAYPIGEAVAAAGIPEGVVSVVNGDASIGPISSATPVSTTSPSPAAPTADGRSGRHVPTNCGRSHSSWAASRRR